MPPASQSLPYQARKPGDVLTQLEGKGTLLFTGNGKKIGTPMVLVSTFPSVIGEKCKTMDHIMARLT